MTFRESVIVGGIVFVTCLAIVLAVFFCTPTISSQQITLEANSIWSNMTDIEKRIAYQNHIHTHVLTNYTFESYLVHIYGHHGAWRAVQP